MDTTDDGGVCTDLRRQVPVGYRAVGRYLPKGAPGSEERQNGRLGDAADDPGDVPQVAPLLARERVGGVGQGLELLGAAPLQRGVPAAEGLGQLCQLPGQGLQSFFHWTDGG